MVDWREAHWASGHGDVRVGMRVDDGCSGGWQGVALVSGLGISGGRSVALAGSGSVPVLGLGSAPVGLVSGVGGCSGLRASGAVVLHALDVGVISLLRCPLRRRGSVGVRWRWRVVAGGWMREGRCRGGCLLFLLLLFVELVLGDLVLVAPVGSG